MFKWIELYKYSKTLYGADIKPQNSLRMDIW